jgi:uncharacterized protein (TIGR00255 family)
MTAYGQSDSNSEGCQVSCEIRTLNSRFIEVNVRMPRNLINLEPEIITQVKTTLGRGKVDLFIDVAKPSDSRGLPQLDPIAARHYLKMFHEFKALALTHEGRTSETLREPSVIDFFRLEGVCVSQASGRGERSTEALNLQVKAAVDAALAEILRNREREGQSLQIAMIDLLTEFTESRKQIEARVSDIRGWVHETYVKRLSKVMEDLQRAGNDVSRPPEERLTAEISMLTDKADIEEELTRLKTHEIEFLNCLTTGDAVGRKLDFLCQELHREVNTISSKLQHRDISERTLDMKQSIERMRQQVQNVE